MARIVYDADFLKNTQLLKKIKTKHDADVAGTGSVLTAFFTSKGIDIAADDTATDAAIVKNTEFDVAEKATEKHYEKRDTLFKPVFENHRKCVQYMKAFLPTPRDLGEWGVTVDNDSLIVYGTDFSAKQVNVKDFIAHHNTFAAGTSPLLPFLTTNGINIANFNTSNNDALTEHNSAEAQNAIKENRREQRDTLYDPVDGHVHDIGNFLIKLNPNNPQSVGDWGFRIDSSPQKDVTREGTLSPGETKTLNLVVLGSELENTGTTAFEIYRGATPVGTAVTINAGKKFTILRGYGTLTILNSNNTTDASYKATFNR